MSTAVSKKNKIIIFMCCHKQYETVPPLCEPIQCGAALNPPIDGICRDNAGDNISHKNREYCELTAHYYAWKNIDADYYGFCHYRRFFAADGCTGRPYITKGELSEKKRKLLLRDEDYWRELVSAYEIIAPNSEDMGISAGKHYCTSKYHYAEDLHLFLEILAEKVPRLTDTAKKYLSQNRQFFCNMFIMDKAHFLEYCEILFDALKEFDCRKKKHGNFQSDRTDGYLGEIFTGIYITYCRENGAKIKELPRLDAGSSVKKRISYTLFPPESKRRFTAKRIVKALGGKQNV
ncbi:MAG: DUF4422 domain-containing protein [Ruminococcaceae bacterium]|nr:DUF4422 domain-containing protein [Oscillospiraceae bacterium]